MAKRVRTVNAALGGGAYEWPSICNGRHPRALSSSPSASPFRPVGAFSRTRRRLPVRAADALAVAARFGHPVPQGGAT